MLLLRELLETLTASIRSVKVMRSTPKSASIMPTLAELDRAPADVNCDRLKSPGMLLSPSGLLIAAYKLLGCLIQRFDTCQKEYRRCKRKTDH